MEMVNAIIQKKHAQDRREEIPSFITKLDSFSSPEARAERAQSGAFHRGAACLLRRSARNSMEKA
jgi:hypothetical protein